MSDDFCPTDPALTDPALVALDHASAHPISVHNGHDTHQNAIKTLSHRRAGSSRRGSGPKKRAHTTLSQKVMIINFIRNNPTWDQATVAKHFQQNGFPTLSQSTISRYIKDEERYRNLALDPTKLHVKKQKQAQSPQILNCMEFWYYQALGQSSDPYFNLNLEVQRKKWKEFENLLAVRNKKRANPPSSFETFKHLHKRFRHPTDARRTAPIDMAAEKERLRHLTDDYPLEDILAMDEICLSYACPPSEPSSLYSMPKLTIALTCSADGSWKEDPVIVGQTPMYVAYPSELTSDNCGFKYYWNTKAVMTCAIWEKYLLDLDEKCRQRDRKVLLLVDVTHVHLLPDPPLANVQVEFIDTARIFGCHPSSPPCHPFAAGITTYFKSEYRVRFCLRALSSDEFGLLDLYNLDQAAATRIIQDAWNCVTPHAITQIFRRSGVVSSRSEDDDSQYEESKEGLIEDGTPTLDPAIEQSIASLTMCLTQLTIKVMNLSEQTDLEAREATPAPSEIDININPELMAQAAQVIGLARSDRQRRHKKPEEQIVNAHEFIDIDCSLPTEIYWDEQDIVEQITREGTGACWSVTHHSISNTISTRGGWSVEEPRIDNNLNNHKRNASAMNEQGDIMVADNEPTPNRRRHVRTARENSQTSPSAPPPPSNNIFEQPTDPSQHSGNSNLDGTYHSHHHPYNELSNFSQQISNLESLRRFCSELIEKSLVDDDDQEDHILGRIRSSIVQQSIPILTDLEDEFKALEAADLLRLVSG
ncbi:hypothetical protein MJO29_002742 [Puccinia striiformis f. sp. tritici]|uniref:uncharacterized protein n=2 Tax=Puccinia striiformis f. sp. tritici TaxID=168172 RepID=UPI0020087ECF|nr:uncharacterized protein Pst134EA_033557 [Puccinia striiformis f. sp. tritici]XP_047810922.1 hypothetical protein Pst134EA_033295 [Puccinia striiformis f. sp. tritici]KAH9440635.1 hypothetical protein Pst134EA_033557 [Puccinia striiformis f. sp. tritici]KAH9471468.1 hypothetical protein Pst134EA_033295 [Puccinia striiformis f. sp. tritici]KAI7964644.1 hypothetical protein MJO29_002742 [Puccinia striiformis f. sp. tritici]